MPPSTLRNSRFDSTPISRCGRVGSSTGAGGIAVRKAFFPEAAGYLASGLFDCGPGVAASRSVQNIHLNETGARHHRDAARDFRQAYFRRGDPSDPEGITANPSDRYKAAVEALAPLGAARGSTVSPMPNIPPFITVM